jgi:hypothetical protein
MRLTVLGETRRPLEQLAGDPRVAPTWVLAREAQHDLSCPTVATTEGSRGKNVAPGFSQSVAKASTIWYSRARVNR